RIITFRGEGLTTIPLEFAYSTDPAVQTANPTISKTSADAVKILRQYVKKAVTAVIKEEAKKAGQENLVSDIGKQIKPTLYYSPILCSKVGTTAAAPPSTAGFSCILQSGIVTQVAYSATNTDSIPEVFQQFTVVLSVLLVYVTTLQEPLGITASSFAGGYVILYATFFLFFCQW
ncbi:hypothetical protein NECAME_19374, partial [Necator americanus]